MNIILTHEQTDFDGLASLLGAHLLDEDAIPVLPRRINRNVRAFITLYGVELPFVDPRDLPNEHIESVCLVDTQSITSIKGMGSKTHIKVIDHHAPRDDIPKHWNVLSEETGANTTLFVEGIQERDLPISVIHATLLLLGIYEDTGSLTYNRTTPRDVRAAAYLLDQGANLSIATDFLNHPLSMEQQAIYDQLRENAESYQVHGHTLIVALGDAGEIDEELSTIAHKLRDLLDPDALILLISIRGGVQLIARSTSDNIDVSNIAAKFGGGGHPRAAAALIKDVDPEDIQDELLEILPEHVHPAITVSQIMSRDPQVLSPDTRVQEAARRMQRYGYEGYPVVEDDQIIGLLTRRAVDRALTHKLNLSVASLMEAGDVSVHPSDSIEHLQNLMTESGWGQIPVIHPDSGNLVGIVTRTDLLKTLAPKTSPPGRNNLSDRLEKALPPIRLALINSIAEIAQQRNDALYIVGGFVRDLLLNHPILDFDLVVEGDAIALARSVQKRFGGRITTHKRFGTAKWFLKDEGTDEEIQIDPDNMVYPGQNSDLPNTLDFITARTEFYTHPTALPTVERGSIKLDLHRRDFTINTLALRLDGRYYGALYDYWGGLNDLEQGVIRVLHSLSFVDDPTRMLRAVRYEQRYQFTIDERTLELLLEARSMLDRVSGDRLRSEIDHILDEDRVVAMMKRLNELGLFKFIHKNLKWDKWFERQLVSLQEGDIDSIWGLSDHIKGIPIKRIIAYALWLIRIDPTQTQKVVRRLKIPSVLSEIILSACRLWQNTPSLKDEKPSQIAKKLDSVPLPAVYACYKASPDDEQRQVLYKYATKWRLIKPVTSGHDLKERGLPPGPIYKHILNRINDAWIDGEVDSEQQEKELVEKLIDKFTQTGAAFEFNTQPD